MTKETPNLTKLRELEARMDEAERKIKTLYKTSGGLATAGLGVTKVLDNHNEAFIAVADALEAIDQRFVEEDRAKTDLAETH